MRRRIDRSLERMIKSSKSEYIEMIRHPRKIIFINFLWGLSRGFGMAVGFTILGAVFLYALRAAVKLNLPVIGQFIAEIVKIVQSNLNK